MQTVSITIKTKNGHYMRDIREVSGTGELIYVINAHLSNGAELIAVEELDDDVLGFYSKTLTDDDLDAMAAEIAS
jgi:hypothetical protein